MSLQIFSTNDASGRERFDYLDDFIRSQFFDIEIDVAPELRPVIEATARVRANCEMVIAELDTTALAFNRSQADVSRSPSGIFLLCKNEHGVSSFKSHGQDAYLSWPGDLAVGSADLVFKSEVVNGPNHRFRLLAMPEARLDRTMLANHPVPLQQLHSASGIGALLSNYYDALWLELEHLNLVQESIAIDTVAQLLAMARGAMSPDDARGEGALNRARVQLARDYIEVNLANPGLTPTMVASAVGVSTRLLHLLFEPTGQTLSRLVQQRRLERARRMLLIDGKRPVITIAFAVGFDSVTTFNRAFRVAYGMSPTEMRRDR